MPEHLRFETVLERDAQAVWTWITSWEGITTEMRPWLTMTLPAQLSGGVTKPSIEAVRPGASLGRSTLKLFSVVPVDWSDLTLIEIEPGRGFIEQSPMGSMTMWRHERFIEPLENDSCRLVDELTFTPRFAARLSRRVVKAFFQHRHRQLRHHLGR